LEKTSQIPKAKPNPSHHAHCPRPSVPLLFWNTSRDGDPTTCLGSCAVQHHSFRQYFFLDIQPKTRGGVKELRVCFPGDEDDEAPMITGFSDDVPMVIA